VVTLELTIQRKVAQGWPVIAEQIQSGILPVRCEGLLRIDHAALLQQITPRGYGAALGAALFQGSVLAAFVRSLAESPAGMRLLLFVEAEDLRILRWERLCAPLDTGWDFLALNQRTLFSLYLPSLTDRRYPPIGLRDLRALVLIASPKGLETYRLAPFDVEAAASRVMKSLDSIPGTLLASTPDGILPGASGPASLEMLCQLITQQPYTVVHVICHGQFSQQRGETSLFLAGDDHRVDRIDSTRLIERLGRLRGLRGLPHFAFLATCQSAAPEAEGALGGLAQRLVRELGMPAVIAMTEKVTIETAQLLTGSFYNRLCEHGEADRALVEATIAIGDRSDATVPAIYSRLGGQPLFSSNLDRALTPAEIDAGLDAVQLLLEERAPVLAGPFKMAASVVRRTLSTDPSSISQVERDEQQEALDAIEQICARAIDHSFKALALGQKPPEYDTRCPFRGLVAFQIADHAFFFGRTQLIEQLRLRLRKHPFLAILGPSGCGKSSLVFAGLVPVLRAEDASLDVRIMTPGSNPVAALRAVTAQLPEMSIPVLLVVDQFEELFTLCPDQAQREAFLSELFAHIDCQPSNDRGGANAQISIVLTLRADFWGDCAPYAQLRDEMLAHQTLISPMDASELRASMEQQSRLVGLRFEADLANTILDDVRGEPGAMPLLQHGLRELWQRRHGRWLAAEEYRAMGGIHKAIAHSAEIIYTALILQEQSQMRSIFTRLTRVDEDALPGDLRRDTRRRLPLGDLILSERERGQTVALVSRLAGDRLLVTTRNHVTEIEEIEVAHEALIREWPRLQEWIAEDQDGIRIQRQLAAAVRQWQESNQDPSFLYRARRLRNVREWQHEHPGWLNQQEELFLETSTQQERRASLTRWAGRAAIILLPLLVALAVMWIGQTGLFAEPAISWRRVDSLTRGAYNIVWDAGGTSYASFSLEGEIAIATSADGGLTWKKSPIPVKGVRPMAADPYMPGRVYAVADEATLWRTDDGGDTWVHLPFDKDVWDVAVSSRQTVYVSAGELAENLFFSMDFGESWELAEDGPDSEIEYIVWIQDHLYMWREDGLWAWSTTDGWDQPFDLSVAWISGLIKHQDELWLATSQGIYILREGAAPEQVTHEKFKKLAYLAFEPAVVVAATDTEVRWFVVDRSNTYTIGRSDDFDNPRTINVVRANSEQPNAIWIAADTGLFWGDPKEYLNQ
jgi:energy-coupling factor transporter ATP-binding protein EcfA2